MKKSKITALLLVSLLAAAVSPAAAAQETELPFTPTVMPEQTNPFVDQSQFALPAEPDENTPVPFAILPPTFDARGTAQETAVRNQNPFGTCWSFSAAAALEASTLSQGVGTTATIDYAEHQLDYFAATQYEGDGIYYSPSDPASATFDGYSFMSFGGSPFTAINTLAAWFGLDTEEKIPYKNTEGNWNPDWTATDDKGDWTLGEEQRKQAALHLQNADVYLVTHRADGSLNDAVMDTLKTAVQANGGIGVSYYYDKAYDVWMNRHNEADFDATESGYFCPEAHGTNHLVTIVGWDDGYDKENFVTSANTAAPAGDGAWIVKNSWTTQYGDGGYFYLSYYDCTTNGFAVYEADLPNENGLYSYDNNYQYDYLGCSSNLYGALGAQVATVANVFTAGSNETLQAVSATTLQAGISVKYGIYLNPTDSAKPDSGTLMEEGTVVPSPGYHTLPLENPIALQAGDVFAVVQEHTLPGGVAVLPIEVGMGDYNLAAAPIIKNQTAAANPGESFVWENGTWVDVTEEGTGAYPGGITINFGNAMIKAFTVNTPTLALDKNAVWVQPLDTAGAEFGEPLYITDENCTMSLPDGTAAVRVVVQQDALVATDALLLTDTTDSKNPQYPEMNWESDRFVSAVIDLAGQNSRHFSLCPSNARGAGTALRFAVGCTPLVDAAGTETAEGTAYAGSTIMVVNADNSIESDEDLAKTVATGAQPTAAPTFLSLDGDTDAAGQADGVSAMRDLDFSTLAAQPVQTETDPTPHFVGETKSIKYGDGTAEAAMVCVNIGAHCTVWLRDITPAGQASPAVQATPETAAQEQSEVRSTPQFEITPEQLAAAFDAIYEAETAKIGSPLRVDVDKDEKIALVVRLGNAEGDPEGYFWPADLTLNGMDMVSLTEKKLTNQDFDDFQFTMAHEFQHLINYAVVGEDSERWLNETFSQNAPAVCGLQYGAKSTYTDDLADFICGTGYSTPFAFTEDYAYQGPGGGTTGMEEGEGATVYAQWYLFGRYLSGLTEGKTGGGEDLYGTVLKSGSCTAKALVQTLYNMGVVGADYENGGFDELLKNYNLALYLQQESGRYSFNGRDVTGFVWPGVLSTLPADLRGGGAAAFAQNADGFFVPAAHGARMVYAGLGVTAANLPPVTPSVPSGGENRPTVGNVTIGQKITLAVPEGYKIHYTVSTDDTLPEEPTLFSTEYAEPILIEQNTILRVATFDAQNRRATAVQTLYYYAAPAAVTASVQGGTVAVGTRVALSCATPGAAILYTVDGTEPSLAGYARGAANGTLYTEPVLIENSRQIRAIAYMPDALETTCVTTAFAWNYHTTPAPTPAPTQPPAETPATPNPTQPPAEAPAAAAGSIPATGDAAPLAAAAILFVLSAVGLAALCTAKKRGD